MGGEVLIALNILQLIKMDLVVGFHELLKLQLFIYYNKYKDLKAVKIVKH